MKKGGLWGKIGVAAVFLGLLGLVVIPVPVASADIIRPGEKTVMISYQLSNLGQYPDYVFLLVRITPSLEGRVIKPGEIFTEYKLSQATIFAIKKADFREEEIGKLKTKEEWVDYLNRVNAVPSGIGLQFSATASDKDPLERATVILSVESLDDQVMVLKIAKMILYYKDGSIKEVTP